MDSDEMNGEGSRGRRSRPGGRAAQFVSAVQAAALALLNERGFEAISIADIAERAGVNKTSIYRRWPSKVELVLDVARAQMRESIPLPDTGSLTRDLTKFLESLAFTLTTPFASGLLRALVSVGNKDSAVAAARNTYWTERFLLSSLVVERAISRRELPLKTDARSFMEFAAAPIFFKTLVTEEDIRSVDIREIVLRTILAFEGDYRGET